MPSERDTVDLPIGLYELLVTSFIDGQIKELDQQYHVGETAFRDAEVADRISYHLANLIEKSVAALPSTDRAKAGIALANNVIETLRTEDRSNKLDLFSLAEPGRVLQSISTSLPDSLIRHRIVNQRAWRATPIGAVKIRSRLC